MGQIAKVIRQKPHYDPAYYGRGIAYRDSQKTGAAIKDLQIAGELFLAEGNQNAYLLVKQNLSSLTRANWQLDHLVGRCLKAVKNSFKTGSMYLLNFFA